MAVKKKKKPRRKIRKSALIAAAVLILAVIGIFTVPGYLTDRKLKKLGYDSAAVKNIKEAELTEIILENNYYSAYLEKVINNHTVREDYLFLYTLVDEDRNLSAVDFLLYNRLLDTGYEEDQLENLFANLTFTELTPLLVFDYQWNEQIYIDDCIENRDQQSDTGFTLSQDYLTAYHLTKEVSDPEASDVLINTRNCLPESYEPSDLTELSSLYSAGTITLRSEAAEAFEALSQASISAGQSFFANDGYRSYETQTNIYNYFVNMEGESLADIDAERAGFSEHETGLAVNVAATYEEGDFETTEVYNWLKENCTEYGFILRYPIEKSSITGYADEPAHLRYLGKELAQAVTSSSLTYDEYYCLYLADWYDDANKPSKKILREADPLN